MIDITPHYVTRPYLTRHGDGEMLDNKEKSVLSKDIMEDRTNHYNDHQGLFRYGMLDIGMLGERIVKDARGLDFVLDVTHCDEMDRIDEFCQEFGTVNAIDTALV